MRAGVVTAAEALRYAMSLPVATVVSGVDGIDVLRQNLAIARGFTPMTAAEMDALRDARRGAWPPTGATSSTRRRRTSTPRSGASSTGTPRATSCRSRLGHPWTSTLTTSSARFPTRPLGKTGATVSAIGVGGHHLGELPDVETAIELVHEAIDAGITFFDNCWEYYNGRSEEWLGRALGGQAGPKSS